MRSWYTVPRVPGIGLGMRYKERWWLYALLCLIDIGRSDGWVISWIERGRVLLLINVSQWRTLSNDESYLFNGWYIRLLRLPFFVRRKTGRMRGAWFNMRDACPCIITAVGAIRTESRKSEDVNRRANAWCRVWQKDPRPYVSPEEGADAWCAEKQYQQISGWPSIMAVLYNTL